MIPANNEDDLSYEECMDDLNRICPDVENAAADTESFFHRLQMIRFLQR